MHKQCSQNYTHERALYLNKEKVLGVVVFALYKVHAQHSYESFGPLFVIERGRQAGMDSGNRAGVRISIRIRPPYSEFPVPRLYSAFSESTTWARAAFSSICRMSFASYTNNAAANCQGSSLFHYIIIHYKQSEHMFYL